MSDLEKPTGLEMVWKILDRAHERMEHERADDAYGAWESAHRKPGQSMDERLTYLRKTKLEVENSRSTPHYLRQALGEQNAERCKASPKEACTSIVQLWWLV